MALFDFLKKSKKTQPHQAPKKSETERREKPKQKEEGQKPVELATSGVAWRILRSPHVTEKTTELTKWNQYVFRIQQGVTKPEVKRAVEEIYKVHVEGVRKVSVPGKKRRRGKYTGWHRGYEKAIVTLRTGERIEVLPH